MAEDLKETGKLFIVIACVLAMIVFSGFAVFGAVDKELFIYVFVGLNIYPSIFFGIRGARKVQMVVKRRRNR